MPWVVAGSAFLGATIGTAIPMKNTLNYGKQHTMLRLAFTFLFFLAMCACFYKAQPPISHSPSFYGS